MKTNFTLNDKTRDRIIDKKPKADHQAFGNKFFKQQNQNDKKVHQLLFH